MSNPAPKPKKYIVINMMTDGTVQVDNKTITWAAAHKLITDGRKHNQSVKSQAAAARKAATKAKNADKVKAQIAAVEAKLAKLQKAA